MFKATPHVMTPTIREEPELLHILSVDACIEENGMNHKTEYYVIMQQKKGLVVRRGQPFYLNVKFNRDYDVENDILYIELKLEVEQYNYEQNYKVPKVLIPLLNSGELKTCWVASINSADKKSMRMKVNIPDGACVGKYHIQFDTLTKTTPPSNFTIDECLYIIFNPWCPDDKIHLNDEEQRQEYVMSQKGLIWTGHVGQVEATPWSFGQFNKDVLNIAFHLINVMAYVDVVDRHDPIHVSRALSALVNGNDYDEGISLRKSDDNDADEKQPQSFVGTSDIIEKFLKEKKPVKCGQCWIYAGVFATLCRALGIPCRIVTNFESAHDTDDNLRVERCFDSKGKEVYDDEFRGYSVWKFHAWNEVWMTRYDLNDERFHGWQVIDVTPQRASTRNGSYKSVYARGPIPVMAIKIGKFDVPFNAEYIFGNIDDDVCHFKKKNDDNVKMFYKVDRLRDGPNINTKAVGSLEREDITDTYKFPKDASN
ncbi:annulin-like [Aphidius gifuensis]|uniref:annulin-like n=1 Tax=Aphidius gifuensis TaxID=684658 RepID=UPI001CDC8389|nr:annulin-like [Aphidius gifuensis]